MDVSWNNTVFPLLLMLLPISSGKQTAQNFAQRVPPSHKVNPHFHHCCRPGEDLAGHFRKWMDQNTMDPEPLFQ